MLIKINAPNETIPYKLMSRLYQNSVTEDCGQRPGPD